MNNDEELVTALQAVVGKKGLLTKRGKTAYYRSGYYGHFMCHVFHQDYIFKKGTDIEAVKKLMVERLEAKGAKLPAEHNVGHMYQAETVLKEFYDKLDPTNTFNPGIGKQSKQARPYPFR